MRESIAKSIIKKRMGMVWYSMVIFYLAYCIRIYEERHIDSLENSNTEKKCPETTHKVSMRVLAGELPPFVIVL